MYMGKTTTSITGSSSSRAGAVITESIATSISNEQLLVKIHEINKVFYDPARQVYIVESEEGRIAVNLDQPHSITHNGQVSEDMLRAAYARALGEQARNAPLSASESVLALGDLQEQIYDLEQQMKDFANSSDPEEISKYQALEAQRQELLAQYGPLAQEVMAEELDVCQDEVADIPVNSPVSRRVAMKRRAEHMGRKLRSFIRGENRQEATLAQAMVFGVNEEGEVNFPSAERLESSRQSAIALGGEHLIPDVEFAFDQRETGEVDENGDPIMEIVSVGDIEANLDFQEALELFSSRVINGGTRLVILSGPPSTGKDTFAEQMAGMLGMPAITKNMGPGYDISDALGGEGIGPQDVHDEEGKYQTTVTGSRRIVGRLADASQHRAAFIMDEIEGMEDDLVRLNTLFGSRVGEPDKRTVSAGSITDDDEIVPDEDFIVFITYNPGHDDIKLPSSVAARALNLSFEYAPPEEEAKIVARMTTAIAKQDKEVEGLADRQFTPEEVRPVVDLIRRLRNHHATDPHIWKDQPDMRQAAHIVHDLVNLGRAKNENALRTTVRRTLAYVLPGSMEMPISQRDSLLDDVIKDYESELNTLVALGQSMIPEEEG